MSGINPYIFRAYDVRGKVGTDITPDVFAQVGRAYGTLVCRRGGKTVALGMDNRVSSGPLKEAFAEGVLSTGVDVVDIGVNHTPLLYFAAAHWKLDGGATVTGSHNPVSDNGVKMVHAGAAPLTEDEIQGLLASVTTGDFERGRGTRTARSPRQEENGLGARDLDALGVGRRIEDTGSAVPLDVGHENLLERRRVLGEYDDAAWVRSFLR